MKRTIFVLTLVAVFVLAGGVLAMESTNYKLPWFMPLTSGGGGETSSTNYAVNLTVGQSAIGAATSTNYAACLGYWCDGEVEHTVFLPLVLRNT